MTYKANVYSTFGRYHFSHDSPYHGKDVIMGAMEPQITGVSGRLLNRLFRLRSKKTPQLRVTGLCAGTSPVTGEVPANKMASDAENVSIMIAWTTGTVPQTVRDYEVSLQTIYNRLYFVVEGHSHTLTCTRATLTVMPNTVRPDGYSSRESLQTDTWWRHQMETYLALLALCAGNSLVTGEFTSQRPVTWRFDVFFALCLNKRLSKQSWSLWFDTPTRSLWRLGNAEYVSGNYRCEKAILPITR